MATCKCGTFNEYQDEPYVCRDCRDKAPGALHEGGVVVGVDPGSKPGTLVVMNGRRSGKSEAMRAILEAEMSKLQQQFADAHAAAYWAPKGGVHVDPGDYVFRQGDYDASPAFFGVNRDEEPVRLARTCAPWEPDAAAVAAKEREILDLVVGRKDFDCFSRGPSKELAKLRDELLTLRTDPDEIQEALDLFEEIQSLRRELEDRMKNMPHSVRSKVYGS